MLFSLLSWLPIHSGHSVRNQGYSSGGSQLQNEKKRKKYSSRFIALPVGYLREWSVHCCSYEYDLATMLWGGKHIHLMGSRGIHQIEWIAKLHSNSLLLHAVIHTCLPNSYNARFHPLPFGWNRRELFHPNAWSQVGWNFFEWNNSKISLHKVVHNPDENDIREEYHFHPGFFSAHKSRPQCD